MESDLEVSLRAQQYLEKVGAESEEEAMEQWEREKTYKVNLIEQCTFELNLCP